MKGASTGEILCDDEDKRNANWTQRQYNGVLSNVADGHIVEAGMIVDKNTTYRVGVSTETQFFNNNMYYPPYRPGI